MSQNKDNIYIAHLLCTGISSQNRPWSETDNIIASNDCIMIQCYWLSTTRQCVNFGTAIAQHNAMHLITFLEFSSKIHCRFYPDRRVSILLTPCVL